MKQNTQKNLAVLVEAALMIALATVLSTFFQLKLWPNGGSVTLFSMVPIVLIAYRHGAKWGLATGFVYSVLQLLLGGLSDLRAVSGGTFVAALFLDFFLPFTLLGLAGIFKGKLSNERLSMGIGAAFVTVLRFLCHFLSGFLLWGSIADDGIGAVIYSLTYNASYMVPEIILTTVAAVLIYPPLAKVLARNKLA